MKLKVLYNDDGEPYKIRTVSSKTADAEFSVEGTRVELGTLTSADFDEAADAAYVDVEKLAEAVTAVKRLPFVETVFIGDYALE